MFGYINVYKDELKVKEYNDFRAYYCGLCKALGKRHNQLVRLGLSYDLTFLAILLDSMYDEKTECDNLGCIKAIAKKKTVIHNRAIDFAADMSIVLMYYKLADDINDDRSIKAFFASIPYWFAVKKLKGKYGGIISGIKSHLRELSDIEKENCDILDRAAHPFAQIMQDIFALANPALATLGYNLGRYVYIADACDDMDADLKRGSYNVLNRVHNYTGSSDEQMKNSIRDTIHLTLGFVASEYEKLPKFKNKQLLDNIIYLGIRAKTDSLLNKLGANERKDETNNE